jgi:hypothetical protein
MTAGVAQLQPRLTTGNLKLGGDVRGVQHDSSFACPRNRLARRTASQHSIHQEAAGNRLDDRRQSGMAGTM